MNKVIGHVSKLSGFSAALLVLMSGTSAAQYTPTSGPITKFPTRSTYPRIISSPDLTREPESLMVGACDCSILWGNDGSMTYLCETPEGRIHSYTTAGRSPLQMDLLEDLQQDCYRDEPVVDTPEELLDYTVE